jgi:hypothetical protein
MGLPDRPLAGQQKAAQADHQERLPHQSRRQGSPGEGSRRRLPVKEGLERIQEAGQTLRLLAPHRLGRYERRDGNRPTRAAAQNSAALRQLLHRAEAQPGQGTHRLTGLNLPQPAPASTAAVADAVADQQAVQLRPLAASPYRVRAHPHTDRLGQAHRPIRSVLTALTSEPRSPRSEQPHKHRPAPITIFLRLMPRFCNRAAPYAGIHAAFRVFLRAESQIGTLPGRLRSALFPIGEPLPYALASRYWVLR